MLIAGGTNGFGLVLAKLLSRFGASVMIVGRSAQGLRDALADCEVAVRRRLLKQPSRASLLISVKMERGTARCCTVS